MLEKVLFPLYEHDLKEDSNAKKALDALELASYLAIDQFGENKGADKLEQLRDYGVKGLPKTVNDPGYFISGGGVNHRKPTHRGWDYEFYSGTLNDYKTWKVRRPIIENTVDKFFDFNGDEKQKDSFCAVIYYIHILGDHIGNSYDNRLNIIQLSKMKDEFGHLKEINDCISNLFSGQKLSNTYCRLKVKLTVLRTKARFNGEDDTKEKQNKVKKYARETLDCLQTYLPGLLKNTDFFYAVFH